MKKTYVKPEINFEDFTLSTNIASGCEVHSVNHSTSGCGVDLSGVSIFLTGMGGCANIQVDDNGGDGEYGGICYHVPYGENLFDS